MASEQAIEELLRDLRHRLDVFALSHPDLAKHGLDLNLTVYDEHGEPAVGLAAVPHEPRPALRARRTLMRLHAASAELYQLLPQEATLGLLTDIERFVAQFKAQQP